MDWELSRGIGGSIHIGGSRRVGGSTCVAFCESFHDDVVVRTDGEGEESPDRSRPSVRRQQSLCGKAVLPPPQSGPSAQGSDPTPARSRLNPPDPRAPGARQDTVIRSTAPVMSIHPHRRYHGFSSSSLASFSSSTNTSRPFSPRRMPPIRFDLCKAARRALTSATRACIRAASAD